MRKQKSKTWVVLLLTSKGEEEARLQDLAKILSNNSYISKEDIYIPVLKNKGDVIFLLEGYIFVKTGYPSSYYYDLVRTPFVESIISEFDSESGLISKGILSDLELRKMIQKANALGGTYEVGTSVKVKEGHFKGLEGEIIDVILGDNIINYCIFIELRSVEIILNLNSFSIGEL